MSAAAPSVVVVGGGLAGLAAAWRLARAGCDVSVVERERQAGGRFAGERVEGFSVDRALPVLSHADRRLLGWSEELSLSGQLFPLRLVQVAQVHRGVVHAIDPGSLRGVARIPGLGWRDAARLLRLPRLARRYRPRLDPERPEGAARWDDRSLADFARLYFGRSALERWIGPETEAQHGGREEDTSRVAFLLQWTAGAAGRARPGVPRAPLFEMPRRAAELLGADLGWEAHVVEPRPGGGFAVAIGAPGRAGTRLEADAVVVALPPHDAVRVAAPVLEPAERDVLAGVEAGPSFTLSAALESPLSGVAQHVRVPHAEDLPVETWLAEPGLPGGRAPEACGLVTAVATRSFAERHRDAPHDTVVKELLDGLERCLPRVSGRVRFVRLHRGERDTPLFPVGHYRRLERFRRVQADRRAAGRRLAWAGGWLVGPRAEAAVASGVRAAEELVGAL